MKKRILSVLFALVLAGALAVNVFAQDATNSTDIIIIHTNDTHCALENGHTIAGVAGYKTLMEETYDYVSLVDAGDFIQGGTYGALSTGQFIIDAYNAAGYDIVTLGNHEFDYQIPRLFELTEQLDAQVVSSNFIELATGESVYDAYTIINYGDVQVAYIGIATPESISKATPSYFQDENGDYIYSFCQEDGGPALYANVQASIDAAKAEGADYIIGLGHMGIDEASAPWRSTDLIANTTGFDVVLDGHSHNEVGETVTDAAGNEVILAQTGEYFENIGVITIDTLTGEITTELISAETDPAPIDETVQALLDEIDAELAVRLQTVVGYTEVALTTVDVQTGERLVRNSETNMGDLVADAYRILMEADVAIVNGGGIRADIDAGDITYEEIIAVQPWGNQATSVAITGQQLLDCLEMGAKDLPDGENGGFPQVSGMTFTIDTTIPSSVITDVDGCFISVDGEYRVCDVFIGGEPLDVTQTYVVASYDYFLLYYGDGMNMFEGATIVKDKFMVDNELLIQYIDQNLGGVVGQEYANYTGDGRITILYDETTQSSDGYTVVAGDCLWNIAAEYLGDGARWREIRDLNAEIGAENIILIGQVLTLPAA